MNEQNAAENKGNSNIGKNLSTQPGITHQVRKIKINGLPARLHMCMNAKKEVVPCSHIHVGFTYDRKLVKGIMKQLPRFVHKHTIVYKMYVTLKLFYLHQ